MARIVFLQLVELVLIVVFATIGTRVLSPQGWGVVSLSLVLLEVLGVVSRFGTDTALLQTVSHARINSGPRHQARLMARAVSSALASSILVTAGITVLLRGSYMATGESRHLAMCLQILVMSLTCLSLSSLLAAFLQAHLFITARYLFHNMGNLAIRCMLLLLTAGLGFEHSSQSVAITIVVASVIVAGMGIAVTASQYPWLFRWHGDYLHPLKFVRRSALLFGYDICHCGVNHANIVLVGFLLSVAHAGVLACALPCHALARIVLDASTNAFAPRIPALIKNGNTRDLSTAFHSFTEWVLRRTLITVIAMWGMAHVIQLLFGQAYTEVGTLLRVLLVSPFINAATGPAASVLVMTRRSGLHFACKALQFVLLVFSSYIMIHLWGLLGAAMAGVLAATITHALRGFIVFRLYGVHPFSSRTLYLCSLGPVILGGLTLLDSWSGAKWDVTLGVTGAAVACFVMATRRTGTPKPGPARTR